MKAIAGTLFLIIAFAALDGLLMAVFQIDDVDHFLKARWARWLVAGEGIITFLVFVHLLVGEGIIDTIGVLGWMGAIVLGLLGGLKWFGVAAAVVLACQTGSRILLVFAGLAALAMGRTPIQKWLLAGPVLMTGITVGTLTLFWVVWWLRRQAARDRETGIEEDRARKQAGSRCVKFYPARKEYDGHPANCTNCGAAWDEHQESVFRHFLNNPEDEQSRTSR